MSVDEALLASATQTASAVTLRLYEFERPTVTFGYGQDLAQACRAKKCAERGVDTIRRVTGGRALLHDRELTYCVTGPRIAPSAKATYARVTSAIRRGLTSLGLELDAPGTVAHRRAPKRLPCLSVATGHEITVAGKKLVASAMRFRRKGFLQHGSILWSVDDPLWRLLTHVPESEPIGAVGIHDLESSVGKSQLIDALGAAFREIFANDSDVPNEEASLTAAEAAHAAALVTKYRSDGWNRSHALP